MVTLGNIAHKNSGRMVELSRRHQHPIGSRNHRAGTACHYPRPSRYAQEDCSIQRLSISSCVCGPHQVLALMHKLTKYVQRGDCYYLPASLRKRHERIRRPVMGYMDCGSFHSNDSGIEYRHCLLSSIQTFPRQPSVIGNELGRNQLWEQTEDLCWNYV